MKNINFNEKVVEMREITKKFGNFTANDKINLTVHKGEVHALLGENGAGKSTLMNILYGLYQQTSGEIYINEKKVNINGPKDAIRLGIGMVHQHFMLVQPFTVAENLILGVEPVKNFTLDMSRAVREVKRISSKYGLHVDPYAKIQDISVGMQQRVEILKALYKGAEILILDEPTAVLTPQEIKELIEIMINLTSQGKSIILITHKLKEIKAAADFCTIIRRGKYIDTVKISDTTEQYLASMMVGREVIFKVEKKEKKPSQSVLKIENLVVQDNRKINVVRSLNLEVKAGEILGIAGIEGNGQSELIEAITGLRKIQSGKVFMNNKDITNKSPKEIIESKISTIPQDRHKHGLILDYTVAENMVLENYHKKPFSKDWNLNYEKVKEFAKGLIDKFDIRPTDMNLKVRALSGGNQQKVIIAREVTNDPDLLIAAQPTRGLDVGAIEFVHRALVEQRNKNKAILLISLELDEIMNISDKIAVIYEGEIVEVMDARNADENKLGFLMAGGGKQSGINQ